MIVKKFTCLKQNFTLSGWQNGLLNKTQISQEIFLRSICLKEKKIRGAYSSSLQRHIMSIIVPQITGN